MAVELPSDLVADVMRSADPARLTAARARLQGGSDTASTAFAGLVDSLQGPERERLDHGLNAAACRRECKEQTAHKDFEHMVLRNLFETLLPKAESDAFGSGPSAGIWRAMAADQLAGVFADGGGIGIASMLAQPDGSRSMRPERQWPYFSLDSIAMFKG